MISEWRDRSGNSRDATLSMGQPKYNSLGGPAGQATVEFRRTGGNDALAIGGTAFFAKDQFYVFRSISSTFDFFGGIQNIFNPPFIFQIILYHQCIAS